MPSIKVTTNYFKSSSRLFGKDGLGTIVRALAIDNARLKIQVAGVPDITDNSTGTAGSKMLDLVVQDTAFDATSAGGAQLTAFNAALVKIENAGKVLGNSINNARTRLGLSTITIATGTQVTPDTVPAQDKTITTANGTAATDFLTGQAAMAKAKANLQRLTWAMKEVLVAIDTASPIVSSMLPTQAPSYNLVALTAASASATGASSVSKAAADAFFTEHANSLAYLIARWNASMGQAGGAPTAVSVVAG